ncbi:MAG: hypothetical protein QM702_25185 [Rubrivivax sp.]
MIAVERGFRRNAMVEPGERFTFDPNPPAPGLPPRKPPKWAAEPGDPRIELAALRASRPMDGRGVDTHQAVIVKAAAGNTDLTGRPLDTVAAAAEKMAAAAAAYVPTVGRGRR